MENILKAKEVISLKKIEATFKIVTPMFMAGSDQKQAEFRIPSLLGALRFWYRATAPADLLNNISKLREAEAKLFGSTDTGQASFLVRDNSSQITTADANNARWANNKHGICYLGYGTMNFRGQVQRNYIKEGSTINIKFIFRPLKDSDIQGLRRALEALSLFGGLGSRSRRGFGSVTLLTLADEDGNDLWQRLGIGRTANTNQQFYQQMESKRIKQGSRPICVYFFKPGSPIANSPESHQFA